MATSKDKLTPGDTIAYGVAATTDLWVVLVAALHRKGVLTEKDIGIILEVLEDVAARQLKNPSTKERGKIMQAVIGRARDSVRTLTSDSPEL